MKNTRSGTNRRGTEKPTTGLHSLQLQLFGSYEGIQSVLASTPTDVLERVLMSTTSSPDGVEVEMEIVTYEDFVVLATVVSQAWKGTKPRLTTSPIHINAPR